ncbi:hypothetical protein KCP71_06440 [Salmonella enterica subsp. enterica]|nr:hypothetical protein KCP71_06440 [Salmonella enterica subsp. enterica]
MIFVAPECAPRRRGDLSALKLPAQSQNYVLAGGTSFRGAPERKRR